MTLSHNAPSFREADFEILANAIDKIPPQKRELFLAKLAILLIANHPEKDALPGWVAIAQAHVIDDPI